MARTIAKDHDSKRELILKGAAKIFAVEGYDRASMSGLAETCGISKANIYHYYASKDDILFDILDTYLSCLLKNIVNGDDAARSPDNRYLRALDQILKAYQGADFEHKLQINELDRLSPEKQAKLRGYQVELVKHVSQIIKSIAPRRFKGNETELHAITMSVFGMLNWFYLWNKSDTSLARSEYAKTIFNLTIKGIKGLS